LDYARKAVDVAEDRQATDIALLDLRAIPTFAEFFVILTGETRRHLDGLAQELDQVLTAAGAQLHHREGSPETGWVLLDFGNLVIHLFGPEERDFYQLDRLWAQAVTLLRIQ